MIAKHRPDVIMATPLYSLSLGDFDYTAMYSAHSLQHASSYYNQQPPTTPLLAALPTLSAYTMEAFTLLSHFNAAISWG